MGQSGAVWRLRRPSLLLFDGRGRRSNRTAVRGRVFNILPSLNGFEAGRQFGGTVETLSNRVARLGLGCVGYPAECGGFLLFAADSEPARYFRACARTRSRLPYLVRAKTRAPSTLLPAGHEGPSLQARHASVGEIPERPVGSSRAESGNSCSLLGETRRGAPDICPRDNSTRLVGSRPGAPSCHSIHAARGFLAHWRRWGAFARLLVPPFRPSGLGVFGLSTCNVGPLLVEPP